MCGQLPEFQLNLTGTNETCLGNGTIKIETTNTAASSTISFVTYKLPNFNTPISTLQNLNGLSNGVYRVIATQTLGSLFNTQEKEITIQNQLTDITFVINTPTSSGCNDTVDMTISVLTGTATGYEIISGPKIFTRQASNIFTELSPGIYKVRVFDDCGQAFVQAYVLNFSQSSIIINELRNVSRSGNCAATFNFTNSFNAFAGSTLNYPITVNYFKIVPNQAEVALSSQVFTYSSDIITTFNKSIEVAANSTYSLKFEVIDGCGRTYNRIFFFDNTPTVFLREESAICGQSFLRILTQNLNFPITIEFLQAPADFVPTIYNSVHPILNNSINLYGSQQNPIPQGQYKIKVTDNCGTVQESETIITSIETIKPIVNQNDAFCSSKTGAFTITMPSGNRLISALITVAPQTYSPTLPNSILVTFNSSGIARATNIPVGLYNVTVIDNCNNTYNLTIVINEIINNSTLLFDERPDCNMGFGSLKINNSDNTKIIAMAITAAPSSFTKALPFDIISNYTEIQSQGFGLYLANLPAGEYTFAGTNACGVIYDVKYTVTGFDGIVDNKFTILPNCGLFRLNFSSPTAGSYWLLKLNLITDSWEHPSTGIPYIEGSIPNATTALNISSSNNFNLSGIFRIIKTRFSYNNFSEGSTLKLCNEDVGEFEYFNKLDIDGVYDINCEINQNLANVYINALGKPPYNFTLKSRNGDTSFNIDNGSNGTFLGLTAGLYTYTVQDECGAIRAGSFAVGTLPNLVTAYKPASMLLCSTNEIQFGTFNLNLQKNPILRNQSRFNYKVTFYNSQNDANNVINAIANTNNYISTSSSETIYARVNHKFIGGCFALTSFELVTGIEPLITLPAKTIICENGTLDLNAMAGFDAYEWSNGSTTQTISITDAGTYSVVVKKKFLDAFCASKPATIIVEKSGPAKLISIKTKDWSENSNYLEVDVSGLGNYEFSLDNIKYQQSSIFDNLRSGLYTIYVRDTNGCEPLLKIETYFLHYPKFFTPNGDGFNDIWQIDAANMEPFLKTRIYDRLGKFIYEINGNTGGWNGTLKGQPLMSDDYWFVVERQDGRVFKGHFSLKR